MRRSLPRRLDALPTLVSLVREFLASEGLADVDPFAVDLVLEELFTNLVRHGHSGSDTIEVELEREDARLRLLLRDRDSERFDPTQAPEVDVTRPIEERRPGGLGIHLVRVLAQEFEYDWQDRVGTTRVTMTVGA